MGSSTELGARGAKRDFENTPRLYPGPTIQQAGFGRVKRTNKALGLIPADGGVDKVDSSKTREDDKADRVGESHRLHPPSHHN